MPVSASRAPGPAGAPDTPSSLRLLLGAACGRSCTVRGRAGFTGPGCKQCCQVEQILARSQSRPSPVPILGMHKAFQLLQPGVREFSGMEGSVEKSPFHALFSKPVQVAPAPSGSTKNQCGLRSARPNPHADRDFENALMGIYPGVECGRDRITDVVSQKLGEPATRVLLACDDLSIGRLHEQPDPLLAGPGFLSKMPQYVVDVLGDLFDLVPRVAVDDDHDVVTEVAEGSEPVQQIPDRVLGVVDPARKLVDGGGQVPTLFADNRCGRTYFVQGLIDLVTFRQVLSV